MSLLTYFIILFLITFISFISLSVVYHRIISLSVVYRRILSKKSSNFTVAKVPYNRKYDVKIIEQELDDWLNWKPSSIGSVDDNIVYYNALPTTTNFTIYADNKKDGILNYSYTKGQCVVIEKGYGLYSFNDIGLD